MIFRVMGIIVLCIIIFLLIINYLEYSKINKQNYETNFQITFELTMHSTIVFSILDHGNEPAELIKILKAMDLPLYDKYILNKCTEDTIYDFSRYLEKKYWYQKKYHSEMMNQNSLKYDYIIFYFIVLAILFVIISASIAYSLFKVKRK